MTDLFRLVYTSRNHLQGSEDALRDEVDAILRASKRNNARVGITGALLFNDGCFAQVLEGPRTAVEATFERIQRDRRHGDVSVLQCEPVAARAFGNWSMAFAGGTPRGRALWDEIAGRTDFDIGRLEADQLCALLLRIVRAEEKAPVDDGAGTAPPAGGGLDVARLRSELGTGVRAPSPTAAAHRVPGPSPAGGPPEVAVLRAALDEERTRTTALRRELDDARVALAGSRAAVEATAAERDIWAGRARALAEALCRDPAVAAAAGPAAPRERPDVRRVL